MDAEPRCVSERALLGLCRATPLDASCGASDGPCGAARAETADADFMEGNMEGKRRRGRLIEVALAGHEALCHTFAYGFTVV